jgi:hypothetical protein
MGNDALRIQAKPIRIRDLFIPHPRFGLSGTVDAML